MQARIVTALSAVALIVAACGGAGSGAATVSPASADPATAAPPVSATLSVVMGELGEYMADADGKTLYVFLKDAQSGASVCYDECATTWPPLTDKVAAGAGADASLLGSTTRTDGATQVTYAGWPLYYFASDETAGETNGQGVKDVWYVVGAAGGPIGADQ